MIFSQAHYVLDYPTLTITYQKGIKELLGYDENEFNYNLLSNYFHPDDRKRYTFIVKAVVEYFENNPAKLFGAEFAITVRLRKKDGSYLHSLRQSTIIETNSENIMTKSFSILSDISHIKRNNYVDWNCTSHGRHVSDLRKHIENKHKNYFTKREMEILNYLQLGKKSKEIGEKLYVSKHTVDTHRRKMLAKSTCSNTVELLGFARKNAII
jgi:DNA-binding CsgD family transcriptional regulator